MSEPITTFARLLAPVTPESFFAEYWDKKPLHVPGSAEKTAQICNWDDFNGLIRMTGVWSDRTFALALDGERIDLRDYCERLPGRDGAAVWSPSPRKVAKYVGQGASIVLDFVETLSPGIRAAAEALQMATGAAINCNAYCSQNQHRAFPSHFDTMDVFALHIEGTKTWRIYEGRFEAPLERPGYDHTSFPPDYHDKAKGKLLMEVEMKPGDLLYMPKGVYHDALASSDACLHLSFGTAQPTGLNLMRWVLDSLDQLPVFRQPLPPHDEPTAYHAHLEALGKALRDVLGDEEVARGFREEQRRRAFASVTSVAIPKPSPRYRVRPQGVKLVRRGSEWQLAAPGGKGALPEGGDAIAKWVLERDHFSRADVAEAFPALQEQALLEVVQSLSAVEAVEAL
ncbi:MAG: cupin domain-containing protein [Pseudomonadota bacterium]|nr:cupin domain-containing protein [Pseudomonadota bacterium]